MADKMAVMNGGLLQQYDRPEIVFDQPVNTFVAALSAARHEPDRRNSIGHRRRRRARRTRRLADQVIACQFAQGASSSVPEVTLGARHSTVRLSTSDIPGSVPGRVYTVEPTGDITFVHVQIGPATLVVSVTPDIRLAANQPIWVTFDQERIHLFDGKTEMALKAV